MQTPTFDAAALQAACKKALTSAAFNKFLTQAMQIVMDDAQAQPEGIVLLPPAGHKQVSFNDHYDCLSVCHTDGSGVNIYRSRTTESDHRTFPPHTWFGSQVLYDADGRSWSSQLPRMVQDDFGNLVAVPA